MLINKQKQKGMNLIELMIALVLGILVSTAAITVYVNNMKTQTANIQLMRLNQDLRAITDLMVRDIRRSGFATSNPENNFNCLKSNPFNKIGLFTSGTALAGASCIVFAYNIDDDLSSNICTIESTDRTGFRVSNGAVQMKVSGGTEATCETGLGKGTWESISGSDITFSVAYTLNQKEIDITEMFADADGVCNIGEACNGCDAGNQCLTSRDVAVSITGTLADGTSQTITEKIRIRNDEFEEVH
jgi:prepilin peptidase dependent protein B